jgi:hypothetical protein
VGSPFPRQCVAFSWQKYPEIWLLYGALGSLLAAIGVYGLLVYTEGQRRDATRAPIQAGMDGGLRAAFWSPRRTI